MWFQRSQVHPLGGYGNIVELAFILGEQLEPPVNRFFDQLRDSERHWAHEVIPGCSIPVPHLNQQPSIFVFRPEITVEDIKLFLLTYIEKSIHWVSTYHGKRKNPPVTNIGAETKNLSVSAFNLRLFFQGVQQVELKASWHKTNIIREHCVTQSWARCTGCVGT